MTMEKKQRQFHSSALPSLLLLTVFALCLLSVLLTGAEVYSGLTEDGSCNHAYRTASSYLFTRLKQGKGVYPEEFGSATALVFPEEVEGKTYLTRIYCYDGWLRELYTAENGTFSPADGEKLLEMDALSVIMVENRITLEFTLPGEAPRQILWSIREDGL